jgi:hypothetical protein
LQSHRPHAIDDQLSNRLAAIRVRVDCDGGTK